MRAFFRLQPVFATCPPPPLLCLLAWVCLQQRRLSNNFSTFLTVKNLLIQTFTQLYMLKKGVFPNKNLFSKILAIYLFFCASSAADRPSPTLGLGVEGRCAGGGGRPHKHCSLSSQAADTTAWLTFSLPSPSPPSFITAAFPPKKSPRRGPLLAEGHA